VKSNRFHFSGIGHLPSQVSLGLFDQAANGEFSSWLQFIAFALCYNLSGGSV
jgi:hypothetical protein